jgi:hypothetical protein
MLQPYLGYASSTHGIGSTIPWVWFKVSLGMLLPVPGYLQPLREAVLSLKDFSEPRKKEVFAFTTAAMRHRHR